MKQVKWDLCGKVPRLQPLSAITAIPGAQLTQLDILGLLQNQIKA